MDQINNPILILDDDIDDCLLYQEAFSMDGFDVLEQIKDNPDFKKVPVVMLSTSCLDKDKKKAKELGAEMFFTKPVNFLGLTQVFSKLVTTYCGG